MVSLGKFLIVRGSNSHILDCALFCCCSGKKFFFRGCGWPNSKSTKRWSASHKHWVEIMDELFTSFLSKDYLTYEFTEKLCCKVADEDLPSLEYNETFWENIFRKKMAERQLHENETPRSRKRKKTGIPKRMRRRLFKAGKRKTKRRHSSLVSLASSSSCSAQNIKTLPVRRRPKPSSSSTPQTKKLQQKEVTVTRRCLFKSRERKRKQASPATTPFKRKPPVTPTIQVPSTDVFSTSCPREQLLAAKLPPVDCSTTVPQTALLRVPEHFKFTDVSSLKQRPPACVTKAAVSLIQNEKKSAIENGKTIDLEEEDRGIGVSIGTLGIFSRAGLGQLEWLAEVAEMQVNAKEEMNWIMKAPDRLDRETRERIAHVLQKFPLNHLVAREGRCSVNVRAFSNLALERYVDDTVIDTALAKIHRQLNLKDSVLCLPAHTITWLDTGDEDFINDCFREIMAGVNPDALSLVLLPVNLKDMHWGLVVIDLVTKQAYFDDGLGWTFSSFWYVHQIVKELQLQFPQCKKFLAEHWRMLQTFQRFGMPRQPANGQIVGSGSCGVGVILSAKDFMEYGRPVPPSWSFNEMTVHRKEIMKLLLPCS